MPSQESASFRSNPNIVQVLDLKHVNPRAWQNKQQRFIGPTLPSNISFMPSKNKAQYQRHGSKPPMLLTLEQEHQPREEGEELYRGPWHLEEEGEVEQTLQLNGEKGLHE